MTVKGMDKLHAALAKLVIDSGEAADISLVGAEAFADDAKTLVAVDTGELKESIHASGKDNGAVIVAGTDHAAHQEWGTSKMPAHPFMRPAIDRKKYVKPMERKVLEKLNV